MPGNEARADSAETRTTLRVCATTSSTATLLGNDSIHVDASNSEDPTVPPLKGGALTTTAWVETGVA